MVHMASIYNIVKLPGLFFGSYHIARQHQNFDADKPNKFHWKDKEIGVLTAISIRVVLA
jgi:hypothetical protein